MIQHTIMKYDVMPRGSTYTIRIQNFAKHLLRPSSLEEGSCLFRQQMAALDVFFVVERSEFGMDLRDQSRQFPLHLLPKASTIKVS